MKITCYYILIYILLISCTKKEKNINKDQEGIQMFASFNKKDTLLKIRYINKTDTNYYFIGSRFSFIDKRSTCDFLYPVLSRKIKKLKNNWTNSGFYKIEGPYDSISMIELNKKIDSIDSYRCNYVPINKYGIGTDSTLMCVFEGICLKRKSEISLYYKIDYKGDNLNNQLEYAVRSQMFLLPKEKERLKLFERINLKGYLPYKRDIYIKDTLNVKYE